MIFSIFKKIFKFIFVEIVYNGHLQTLGALGIVMFSSSLLKVEVAWESLLILYLSFYSFYLYNRYKEKDIDYLTNQTRTKHIKKIDNYVPYIILVILLTLATLLCYFGDFHFVIFVLIIVVFGFLYTSYFKNLTKKITIFKNIYVSSVFAMLVFFSIIYHSLPLKNFLASGIAIMIFVFLKALIVQVFLDLKDIKCDQKEGLRTLGVLLGQKKVLQILKIASIVIAGFIPLFLLSLNIFPSSILMIFVLIPFNFYCFNLVEKGKISGFIIGSGEFIIWPILILLGNKFL